MARRRQVPPLRRPEPWNGHRRDDRSPAAEKPTDWLVRLHPRADTLYVSQSRTVLATDTDGFIQGEEQHGLWMYETRNLSRYRWLIQGKQPRCAGESNVKQHTWLGYYIASPPNIRNSGLDENDPAQQTIELRLSRVVGDGMHEDVDLTNFTQISTTLQLDLEVDGDFADRAETEGRRQQKGTLKRRWQNLGNGAWELDFDYRAQHAYSHQGDRGVARMQRGLTLRIERATSPPSWRRGRISFRVRLEPHSSWHACLSWTPRVEGVQMPLLYRCRPFFGVQSEWDEKRETFLQDATHFRTLESHTFANVVVGALKQSKRDLAGLRLYDLDDDSGAWVMAAGLPVYVALFGRDALATAWEASLLGPEMMRGVLGIHKEWQGDRFDDWRDEQPGRILHEAHTSPLSVLNFKPQARYYGGVTGSAYYPTVAVTLWHWTGRKEWVEPYIAPALRGLEWMDKYGDIDGDGLYEYKTRSQQGEKNQGWKDSGDAIVYADGSQVNPPLGTCEEQAFVFASKLFMSELLTWFGELHLAKRMYREAQELRKRFSDAFWMDDEGYIAMGLDAHKRQITSVASDPGHCLVSGIVEESVAKRVAQRLLAPDLFTGWGVRTLSSKHPAFNPYSYHRGSVWPVENGVFTLAMARYGLHEEMNCLARALFEAAALFDYHRLPEVFAGHQRDEDHPFPALYPKANWPQAWSSSAVFTILQAMLGLYPYAPLDALMVDPHLPDWLPEITIQGLRVADARVTLRFRRKDDGSSTYDVLDQRGTLHVVRQPSPWSLTAGLGERVKDAIMSLLPAK